MRLRLWRCALTVHVEQLTSEVVVEDGTDRPEAAPRPSPAAEAVRAELERLRRDALRTAAEGYGD